MFALSAFTGFIIVILVMFEYYSFIAFILVVFIYLCLLERKNNRLYNRILYSYIGAGILCGFIFGIFTYRRYEPHILKEPLIKVTATITAITEKTLTVDLPFENGRIVKIKLSKKDNESVDPFLFDRIHFSCNLWRVRKTTNLFTTLEKLQGIYNICAESKIDHIDENFTAFNNLRRSIRNHVRHSLDLLGESSFARGFVLNDTSNITPVELNLFRKMGIAHLFSASGLHMGLLYATCFFPFSHIGLRKTGYAVALILCFTYLCVLDFNIPLLRSFIFISLYIFLKLLKRSTQSKYILYFSLMLFELIFPLSCFTPSFILSFLITLMILLYYPQFLKIFTFKNKFLKENLAITISASLGSTFLSIYLFNYYHPASIIYNLTLVPLSGIYLASIFIYLFIPIFKYIILAGDILFRQACWMHYLIIEKNLPGNQETFTQFWLICFFTLSLYFIVYSFKHQYWYLRKYYLKTYILLSFTFLLNFFFIKIPASSALAFPYGVVLYKNGNYYISGNPADFYKDQMKYLLQNLNLPFQKIYASESFVPLLHENIIPEKENIYLLNKGQKSKVIKFSDDCFLFLNHKRPLKKIPKSYLTCNNLYLVHSKNSVPDYESMKKLFSAVTFSGNVHYMNYYTWVSEYKNEQHD